MLQQQIVDYAKAQLKLAVSKDAIRSTLLNAGWPAMDIDDSMKNLDPAPASSTYFSMPSVVEKKPQGMSQSPPISISDLMGGSKNNQMPMAGSSLKKPEKAMESPVSAAQKKMDMPKIGNANVLPIVLGVVALLAIGGGVYFFIQNQSLQSKLADLSNQVDSANAKTAVLNSKLNNVTAQNKEAVDSLKGESAQLSSELFFLIAPQSLDASGTIDFSLKGTLAGGDKVPYTVVSSDGIKVSIKNSKDAKVDAALKDFIGKVVTIAGTHASGSKEVMMTSVNGTPVQ